jgi:hypothetical protein
MHHTWEKWIATIRTNVSKSFFDKMFSPVVSSSNNNFVKTISLTLPSNLIVQFYLKGREFTSSDWRMALYFALYWSVNIFDSSEKPVSLKFNIAQNNTWSKAIGFVIAFS